MRFLIALPPFLLSGNDGRDLWIGGCRVIDGVMSVGALVAFQTLMANFNRPFGDLVRLGSSVQSLQAELARLDDVSQYPLDPVFELPTSRCADPSVRVWTIRRDPSAEAALRSGHLELRGRDIRLSIARSMSR